MKRHVPVSYDLDGETRNHATKRALHEHGLSDIHVLTLGSTTPTLVLLRKGDELGFVEVMKAQGWDYEKIESSNPESPAYWVRHPSPFIGKSRITSEGRVFPPDSPCPTDVEHARHQNGCVFRCVRYGSSPPRWRALRELEGDGHEYDWHILNSSRHDGSPMVEIFLPDEDRRQPVEDLRNPVWRAVEKVVTPERLSEADLPNMIVDLVYDAVVTALIESRWHPLLGIRREAIEINRRWAEAQVARFWPKTQEDL